ncbi:hypothetical protein [Pseudomonas schmalbachii]|uniref:Uncharacterized protein n=1 Tax=Pseudomonas schmalbachii TaxID=2816993 RepID=A0ABS3TKH2_9PSED|nr:hypothetical protein [Pseudomonas schmalbachii]MBO3274157.1 hypothetical protein [Pseudomonas schmalbachii]
MQCRAEIAVQVIRDEVECQRRADWPSINPGVGMIRMAYALGLLGDLQEIVLTRSLIEAVRDRRNELRHQRHLTLIQGCEP